MKTDSNTAPEGYMINGQGHLVPISQVRPIDIQRDSLVKELFAQAEKLEEHIHDFKDRITGDIAAFVELSFEQHGVKRGGKKGNITLTTYAQDLRIRLDISEEIRFTEQLLAARELIDECLHDWTDGAKDQLKALINHVFEVDKEGNISATKVLGLRRYNIDDERWLRAMRIIGESIQIAGTKPRLTFARRDERGEWKTINLNVSTA
ncbi:DUF3164 family protein [Desulfuromonas sp. TF]|uniref:DUF3164 family protein n=1 Tax=Desulfuromonas sp. TF TaxID=1232410 RepID=UPI0003F8771D|nr:DUF3164 family protein [Desulfuromonas sp. TF]